MPQRPKVYLFDHSPHLRREWDYERNSTNGDNVSIGSTLKFWWVCPEKHSYSATAKHRKAGTGCPFCTGRRVLVGFNDLNTTRPDLAQEWDYTKNMSKTPLSIVSGHNGGAWWLCPKGHSYTASVNNRAFLGRGCPYCSSQKLLAGFNDLKTTHPEIAKELNDPDVKSTELFAGSHRKVRWKCSKGHHWTTAPYNRVAGNGCSVCSNHTVVTGVNDLQTTHPRLYAELKDKSLGTQISAGYSKKVDWVCENGHVWSAIVNSRCRGGHGCPICSNIIVLPGYNDLKTTSPDLYAELEDKSLAGSLSPSSATKVGWVCTEGHKWDATVNSRASRLTGCPKCCLNHTSKIETKLRILMSDIGVLRSNDHTHRLAVPYRKNKTMSVDIYAEVLGVRLVCEYDGSYFHASPLSISRDTDKTNALLEAGYAVIRIRENTLPHLEISHPNLLQISVPYSIKDDNLIRAVDQIKQWLESKNA